MLVDLGLVDDGIDGDGGLARGTVTDNELPLAPAYGNHGVYRHDAGLEWLVDGFSGYDSGGYPFDRIGLTRIERAFPVDGAAYGVDHATEEFHPYVYGEKFPGSLGLVPFLEGTGITQDDASYAILLEVEGDPRARRWEIRPSR